MSLFNQLKDNLSVAIRSNDTTAKTSLRSLLSKLQTSGQESDEAVMAAARTIIKQNEESIESRLGRCKMSDGTIREISVSGQEDEVARLHSEINVLSSFLPQYLSAEKIGFILTESENLQKIKSVKNSGAAIGIARKILKDHGAVDGVVVRDIVASIY